VFKRLFIALWRYLWPISRIDPLIWCYVLPDALGTLKLTEWFVLCRVWVHTSGGANAIDSRLVKFDGNERTRLAKMIKLGYLVRSSFDPASPRLVSSRCINRVYISFTPSGIRFVRGVLQSISKAVRDDLLQAQPLSK
jgi:hypothetical protein